jgi:hypothetical protein
VVRRIFLPPEDEAYMLFRNVCTTTRCVIDQKRSVPKYTVMSSEQHAGNYHNINRGNKSTERVEQFKYLGTSVTSDNCNQEQIKSRLKSGNDCCHSVQNLLSSSLLFKNMKMNIYRTVIFPVVLYGCETWSLIWREEHRLWVFENRVLSRIFVTKRDRVTGDWRRLHMEELYVLYFSPDMI